MKSQIFSRILLGLGLFIFTYSSTQVYCDPYDFLVSSESNETGVEDIDDAKKFIEEKEILATSLNNILFLEAHLFNTHIADSEFSEYVQTIHVPPPEFQS